MPVDHSKPVTLHRSCQACVKGKRRCDQAWPKCSRCLDRDIDCNYLNIPLTADLTKRKSTVRDADPQPLIANAFAPRIRAPPQLEIAKDYDRNITRFLIAELRNLPIQFAENKKTIFIHPDLYTNGLPTPIREVHDFCTLNMQIGRIGQVSYTLLSLLRQQSIQLHRRLNHAATFEELLGCSQAWILIQCILILNEHGDTIPYSHSISEMLAGVATRLWHQAPSQLPRALSPKRAWLLAESVRRTIIVCFILRSAYSLFTRNYSVRTPFIDALPFDLRTNLWDTDSEDLWPHSSSPSHSSMVSMHQWSDGLAAGRVHDISEFSALILAACKGQSVSQIPFPPVKSYIDR